METCLGRSLTKGELSIYQVDERENVMAFLRWTSFDFAKTSSAITYGVNGK